MFTRRFLFLGLNENARPQCPSYGPTVPKRGCSSGGALVFALVAAALLVMGAAYTLAASADARRRSAAYPERAGLYGLAVSGNRRALRRLNGELAGIRDALASAASAEVLADEAILERAAFRDGRFLLEAEPGGDAPYAAAYRRLVYEELPSVLEELFRDGAAWSVSLSAGGGARPETVAAATRLAAESGVEGFTVHTRLDPYRGETPGYPVTARARLVWEAPEEHEAVLRPEYAWRDGQPPEPFKAALSAGGGVYTETEEDGMAPPEPLPPGGAALPAAGPLMRASDDGRWARLAASGEAGLFVADTSFDVSALPAGVPACVIFTGSPAVLYASSHNSFSGVVIAQGDLTVDGVNTKGTVLAAGDIYLRGTPESEPDPQALMKTAAAFREEARRDLFDLLRLSDFENAEDGAALADISDRLAFASGTGLLPIDFDGSSLEMIESIQVDS